MEKTLIIVDFQRDFLLPSGKLNLGHDTTELIKRVSSYTREFKGHLILTMDTHLDSDCEFTQFPPHCIKYSDGWYFVDELAAVTVDRLSARPVDYKPEFESGGWDSPSDNTRDIILKKSFSGSDIESSLSEEILKSEIHIVGVVAHICVHDIVASIVHFSKEKFNILPNIIIHRDMIDDFDPDMMEFALKRMQNLYGVKII